MKPPSHFYLLLFRIPRPISEALNPVSIISFLLTFQSTPITMDTTPAHLMDPELMPQGYREDANSEMEVCWCFRKLTSKSSPLFCFSVANLTTFIPLDNAFDEAHADADDQRPLILRKCDHSSFQNCICPPSGVSTESLIEHSHDRSIADLNGTYDE